ncbi:stress enhanced protein 1, chloroplastic isoform X1 [Magnolia sinica]|uniref:stress enhanced protein 1, chloroplastic isoform X1 n=1 Tax=Magnolia sinica TaxID=86752 RepID=UPI002658D787|nr:stress enhanced protein 1, chloroplastic isoform X1 [Magnolia sinica]
MAQAAHVSASLCLSLAGDVNSTKSIIHARSLPQILSSKAPRIVSSSFARGSPLVVWRTSSQRKSECKATSFSVRCEQSTKESNSLDVWLGRLAMVGFASAITVEIATGKGLLEVLQNFGLTAPLPTVALAVTALVGVLTAVFIFQSAAKD